MSKLSPESVDNIQTVFFDKQDNSNKTITFNVSVIDPNTLCEKLRRILEKPVKLEFDVTMTKVIIDEIL